MLDADGALLSYCRIMSITEGAMTKNKAAAKVALMVALKKAIPEAYKTGDDSEVHRLMAELRKLG